MTVVGYAYDADQHCVDCTKEYVIRHIAHFTEKKVNEILDGTLEFVDSEGNMLHPIFSTDEAGDSPDHCGDCGAYIDTSWHTETVIYAVSALWEYVEAYVDISKSKGNVEVLDIWANELRNCNIDKNDEFVLFMYDAVRKDWDERDDASR
jgi:hypothetical protein